LANDPTATKMKLPKTIIFLIVGMEIIKASPLPIDPMWKSESFIKAYTASYGIDSRIEPNLDAEEKKVLVSVAEKMGNKDRLGAIALISQSPLTEKSPALLFNLASLHFENGKVQTAISNFLKAIEFQPNFRDAHRNLAIAYVQENNFEKAEPSLRKAIELGSNDGLTMGLLGYCLNQSGRSNDALQAYRMAKLTMPNELQWQIGEATALMDLGSLEEAISIYESILLSEPNRVGIWVNLANIRIQQGKYVQAIADLEVARRLEGLNPESLISLGHLYLNESLQERALSCYKKAIEKPELIDVSKLTKPIDYLMRFNLWGAAKGLIMDINKVEEFNAKISEDKQLNQRFDRADILIEMNIGNQVIAVKRLEELLKNDPLDGEAILILADYYLQQKSSEKSIMLLEQAAHIQEFTAKSERILGEIYASRGDYEKALTSLQKSQNLEPHKALQEYIESIQKLKDVFERK